MTKLRRVEKTQREDAAGQGERTRGKKTVHSVGDPLPLRRNPSLPDLHFFPPSDDRRQLPVRKPPCERLIRQEMTLRHQEITPPAQAIIDWRRREERGDSEAEKYLFPSTGPTLSSLPSSS